MLNLVFCPRADRCRSVSVTKLPIELRASRQLINQLYIIQLYPIKPTIYLIYIYMQKVYE